MKYCLDCDWSLNAADEPSQRDRSQAAIDHHVETGHTIDSSESIVRPTAPDVPGSVLVRDLVPSSD
ncbi:hypothetical protein [Natrinema versiforme]|uniref:Uncharacterized protein n=1 Tax=Natrinema versiforme JCM 10478 TaxID=1227496 RepID=L9Y2M5_9EURY|nr:hypothetical protein [Natrinema versiforme]ELY67931.1 hypothetical protein C489_07995 [Natrinema versiforme JCM 10478]